MLTKVLGLVAACLLCALSHKMSVSEDGSVVNEGEEEANVNVDGFMEAAAAVDTEVKSSVDMIAEELTQAYTEKVNIMKLISLLEGRMGHAAASSPDHDKPGFSPWSVKVAPNQDACVAALEDLQKAVGDWNQGVKIEFSANPASFRMSCLEAEGCTMTQNQHWAAAPLWKAAALKKPEVKDAFEQLTHDPNSKPVRCQPAVDRVTKAKFITVWKHACFTEVNGKTPAKPC